MTRNRASATVTLTWPLASWPNPNRDRRKHWTRERAEARAIRGAAAEAGADQVTIVGTVPSPVQVTLHWAFPDGRQRDLENWSSKALIDGIVDSGLITGDSHTDIVRIVRDLDPERSERGTLRVTAEIEEVG